MSAVTLKAEVWSVVKVRPEQSECDRVEAALYDHTKAIEAVDTPGLTKAQWTIIFLKTTTVDTLSSTAGRDLGERVDKLVSEAYRLAEYQQGRLQSFSGFGVTPVVFGSREDAESYCVRNDVYA